MRCSSITSVTQVFLSVCLFALLAGCNKAEPLTEVTARSQPTGTVEHIEPAAAIAIETNSESPAAVTNSAEPAEELTAPEPVAPPEPQSSRSVLLKVKWPAGNRYFYRMDMEQHGTNQMPQTPEPAREDITTGVSYALTVLAPAPNEGPVIEVELLAFETEIRLGQEVAVHFDSAEAKNQTGPAIPQPYYNVVGSKVRLQMDPDGKVSKVLGYDEWVRDVAGDPSGPARQMLVQQFNPGFFQQMADFGRSLPPKPVKLGEHWPHKTAVPAGELGTITLNSTITLKKIEARGQEEFAVIDANGTLNSRPLNSAADNPRLWIEQGTVTGTSWFQPEGGVLMESVVTQSMQVRGAPPAPDGSNAVPASYISDIGQKVTVKLTELRKAESR